MDLSILIPSRHEMFLKQTVEDILKNIEADTEIIVGFDGEWPIEPLSQHERLNVVLVNKAIGQRGITNLACKLSRAKYVMKVDAHCAFDKGFDRKMLEAFKKTGDKVTIVPIMRNLWVFDWKCYHCGWKRYQGRTPEKCEQCGKSDKLRRKIVWIGKSNPQSRSYCFDSKPHFQYFGGHTKTKKYKKDRDEKGLTETMSLQGSCFMLTRKKYWELNICDEELGNWGNQGIETACKTWLSGGKVLVNHKTWYAHMFRTQGGDFGFPWPTSGRAVRETKKKTWEMFFGNRWPLQKKPVSWLVERFWPVKGWTDEDLKELKTKEVKFDSKGAASKPTRKKLPSFGVIFSAQPSKGIIYYTDNKLKLKIAHAVQNQLRKVSKEFGFPIVSASLKPMRRFGDKNIYFPTLKRGYLTMFKQILGALENSWTDIVFFCEHDVLYCPSHFEFIPPQKDKFYYNQNFWKLRLEDGHALHYDANQTNALCCYKELAIKEFQKRIEVFVKEGSRNNLDFELSINDKNLGIWKSALPIIDIRHKNNLTKNRWRGDKLPSCQGWIETDDEIPGWGKTKDLIKKLS